MGGDIKCWKCVGTGKVLGSGLYNYEPCPLCRVEDYKSWKSISELKKEKADYAQSIKNNTI